MFWYPIFKKKYVDDLQQKGSIIIICGKCVYDFTKYVKDSQNFKGKVISNESFVDFNKTLGDYRDF